MTSVDTIVVITTVNMSIMITIARSTAIHSHILCKHASKHDEVRSVGAKNTRSDRISE